MSTKEEINNLLLKVKRSGIEDLTDWLNDSDFFEAPASTKGHGNYVGGLADHTLNTYDSLSLINDSFRDKETQYSDETIIIVSILHDLCKVNTYKQDDEHATGPQLTYLKDLIDKDHHAVMPSEEQRTKGYVGKLIEFLKNGGTFPEFTNTWKVIDELPMGHGEKSVYLAQKFINLTDEEALAIRWHLGANDHGTAFFYPSGVALNESVSKYPLVPMLTAADYMATWLVDIKK